MKYWLMKSEPDVFGILDLQQCPDGTEHWDGIRNYTARNYMRDEMSPGDQVIFYHSNAKPPGVAGWAEIVSEPYPDHTAFDPEAKYYDPKSDPDNPRWVMVDVKFRSLVKRFVSLKEIKSTSALKGMKLITHSRLSISPVTKQEWLKIREMAGE